MLAVLLVGAALGAAQLTGGAPPAQTLSPASRETPIPAEVVDFFRCYFSAVEAGDSEALLTLIDADFVIQWPMSPPITDRQRLRAALTGIFGRVRQQVEWRVVDGAAAGDWAWVRVHERATHTPKAGGERRVLEGTHLTILRKVDGRWRLHRDTGALDQPPSSPP